LVILNLSVESQDCSSFLSCKQCTNASSWLSTCRWCPEDNTCHAYGSALNPCNPSQNIADPTKCPANPKTKYNQILGHSALLFAYSAYYTQNGEPSVNNTLLPATFIVNSTYVIKVPFSLASTCLGYIGVDHVQKQIVLGFRGTLVGGLSDLIAGQLIEEILGAVVDLLIGGVQLWPDMPDVKVASYYGEAAPLLMDMTISALGIIQSYPDYQILVTGHSLGGALASISATTLQRTLQGNRDIMLVTFGQPRTGNQAYANYVDKMLPGIAFRVVANKDLIPHAPPELVGAVHHGVEIWYPSGGDSPDSVPCGYLECTTSDEDSACSDGLLLPDSIYDHIHTYWCAVPKGFCNPTTTEFCPSF